MTQFVNERKPPLTSPQHEPLEDTAAPSPLSHQAAADIHRKNSDTGGMEGNAVYARQEIYDCFFMGDQPTLINT